MARKCRVVTAFRNTLGLEGRLSTRLQPNHPTDDATGIAASILDGLMLWQRRRRDRHQSGHRQCGAGGLAAAPARWRDRPVPDSHPVLRAHACHQYHRGDTPRRAGRPGVPVGGRHRGGQPQLRHRPGAAGRGPGGGAVAGARHGGQQRHVFRDGAGQRAVGRRPSRHGPADLRGARVRGGARVSSRCWSIRWSVSSAPNICTTASRSSARGWKTISAPSCWACPWAATSATPTMRKPTRTTWSACLTMLGAAGCNFIMGVPGADDIMLGYQSTSFHDALYARRVLGLGAAPEFEAWLARMRITRPTASFRRNWRRHSRRRCGGWPGNRCKWRPGWPCRCDNQPSPLSDAIMLPPDPALSPILSTRRRPKTGTPSARKATACSTTCSTMRSRYASAPSGKPRPPRRAPALPSRCRARRASWPTPTPPSCTTCCPTRWAMCIPASWAGCMAAARRSACWPRCWRPA